MVTDTAPFRYPHYHTVEDTPDKLDYEPARNIVWPVMVEFRTVMFLVRLSSMLMPVSVSPSMAMCDAGLKVQGHAHRGAHFRLERDCGGLRTSPEGAVAPGGQADSRAPDRPREDVVQGARRRVQCTSDRTTTVWGRRHVACGSQVWPGRAVTIRGHRTARVAEAAVPLPATSLTALCACRDMPRASLRTRHGGDLPMKAIPVTCHRCAGHEYAPYAPLVFYRRAELWYGGVQVRVGF